MEVSPEVYAWLSALNIIDPFSETDKTGQKNYFIPENTLNALFNGEYMNVLLLDLQEAYNKYYDTRKDCAPKLKQLVLKEKNSDKISEKTRLNNWNIINEALKIFGIKYSKNEINKVVSRNNEILIQMISYIFNIVTKYLKYTKRDVNKNNNTLKNNSKNIRNNNLNLNLNFSKNQKNNNLLDDNNNSNNNNKILQKEISNISNINENKNVIIKNFSENTINNSLNLLNSQLKNNLEPFDNNINENNNINTNINNNINDNNINTNISENNNINNINNNNNNDILNSKIPLTEYVDVEKISENTLYENCESTLEFFIVSLCKNFQLKPIQAIGLLSNNRQYLSVLCRSGINGNYITIKKWLEDLQINYDILLKLIFKYQDGVYMTYCIIGTALCSKNYDISLYAVDLLNQLYKNVGMDNNWFIKIGINSFIFAFIKHSDRILYFLNIMCEFIKNDESIFFKEIKNKMNNDAEYKILIFDIFPNIISVSKKINNKNFFNSFKDFVFDICLHEEKNLTYSCSVLCESFFYYNQMIDNDLSNKIILFFKKCIRSNNSNIYGPTISKIFILISKLGYLYEQHAPILYKCLISLFIEMYDDIEKREIFLLNCFQFLKEHKTIPLDIFLEPYISLLRQTNNYNLSDFNFLSKIINHPRIEYNDIINIINFLLKVSFNDILFNKCSIYVFEKMITDLLPNKNIEDRQIQELSIIFIDYINQILEMYIINYINNYNENLNEENEDYSDKNETLLEMSYIIIQQDFGDVNSCIKIKVIECAKKFYDVHRRHSGILLGMLKKYEDFGDILFEIEQY